MKSKTKNEAGLKKGSVDKNPDTTQYESIEPEQGSSKMVMEEQYGECTCILYLCSHYLE